MGPLGASAERRSHLRARDGLASLWTGAEQWRPFAFRVGDAFSRFHRPPVPYWLFQQVVVVSRCPHLRESCDKHLKATYLCCLKTDPIVVLDLENKRVTLGVLLMVVLKYRKDVTGHLWVVGTLQGLCDEGKEVLREAASQVCADWVLVCV